MTDTVFLLVLSVTLNVYLASELYRTARKLWDTNEVLDITKAAMVRATLAAKIARVALGAVQISLRSSISTRQREAARN